MSRRIQITASVSGLVVAGMRLCATHDGATAKFAEKPTTRSFYKGEWLRLLATPNEDKRRFDDDISVFPVTATQEHGAVIGVCDWDEWILDLLDRNTRMLLSRYVDSHAGTMRTSEAYIQHKMRTGAALTEGEITVYLDMVLRIALKRILSDVEDTSGYYLYDGLLLVLTPDGVFSVGEVMQMDEDVTVVRVRPALPWNTDTT